MKTILPLLMTLTALTSAAEPPLWEREGGVWTNVVPETWTKALAPVIPVRPATFPPVTDFPPCGPAVSAGIADIAGVPQFTLDGKPVYALWGTVRCDKLVRHSAAPLNFVTIWNSSHLFWPRGEEIDGNYLDFSMKHNLELYPDAYFLFDLTMYPPKDWAEANPGELVRSDGEDLTRDPDTGGSNYSFASEKAVALLERMTEKLVRYLESRPYANRIIGYRLNSGHTAEWLGWYADKPGTVLDFSPVAKRRFAEFAAAEYPELEDARIPGFAERTELDAPYSVIWDQRRHLATVAYHDFYSRLVADAAVRICRKGRELVGRRKLIGTYFGYVMTLPEGGNTQMLAHYATKRFLDQAAGTVDFLMSPPGYSYGQRGLGDTLADMKPFASIRDHGILSVVEDDMRTHMNPRGTGFQATLTAAQSRELMRRNMGISLCRNMPFYTYAITSGRDFDFPEFAEDAAKLREAGERAVARGVRRHAEIALVVSESSFLSMPMMNRAEREHWPAGVQCYRPGGSVDRIETFGGAPFCGFTYSKLGNELSLTGAPVDYRLAEDLADNPGDYRLYILTGCFKYDAKLAAAAAKLRERDCTILWVYAPGAMALDGDRAANMKALTGLDLVPVAAQDAEISCPDGRKFGRTGHPVTPLFAVRNPDRVLGVYADGSAGYAEARTGRARSVFSGAYLLDHGMLAALAESAGVHRYVASDDPMEANSAFVTLHARTAGRKTVKLPRKGTVRNVFTGETLATGVTEYSFEAPLFSSWLFEY